VILNGAFSFVQEYWADRAAEALRELVPHRVTLSATGCARTSRPRISSSVTS
jgi:hypothetical protein